MFVSLKANKKRVVAFLILAAAVAGACLYLNWGKQAQEPVPATVSGETNEERLSYLQSFGWEVEADPTETREVMIPAQFNDVYENYNAMQQAQGFDLRPYAGEVCTQYKYHITNYPGETEVFATLLVHGQLVIGGDIACAEVDGFMHGFAKDSCRYGEATPRPAEPAASPEAGSENSGIESAASSMGNAGQENSYVNEGNAGTSGEAASTVENVVDSVGDSGVETQENGTESTDADIENVYPTD